MKVAAFTQLALLLVIATSFGDGLPMLLNYTIAENEPAPQQIANLTADSLRTGIVASILGNESAENFQLSLSREQLPQIVGQPSNFPLLIDDGILLTRLLLDREVHGSFINLNVLLAARRRSAAPNERPFAITTFRVVVTVTDVNDNYPKWPELAGDDGIATVRFSEAATPGSIQLIAGANDADADANGIVSYTKSCTVVTSNNSKLCGTRDPFSLGLPTAGELAVRLESPLDRETVSEYSFVVTAHDHGRPRLSATLNVRVLVSDVNDHAPKFTRTNYSVSIAENHPLNQPFLRVIARDPDDGPSGYVTYTVRSSSQPDLVTIDSSSGELSLVRPLDYEKAPIIDIRVQARDDDRPPKSSTVLVSILVVDVNDAAPFISLHDCGDPMAPIVEVEEHRSPFVTGCRITAVDEDAGTAGEVLCEVTGNEATLFDLESANSSPDSPDPPSRSAQRNPSYFLRLRKPLDREVNSRYDVRIQCSDFGSPPLASTVLLLVRVTDINDCTPTLALAHAIENIPSSAAAQPRWYAEARENSEPGTVVTRLGAIDCDEGVNAQVEYALLNQTLLLATDISSTNTHEVYTQPFELDRQTGELRLIGSLDRELHSRFQLQVLLRDAGATPRSSIATIEVNVIDENDNPSVLNARNYAFFVEENSIGMQLGRVRATDRDSGDNARFSFQLEEVADEKEPQKHKFHLDEFTGVLTNVIKLDRETRAVYRFRVVVTDRFRKYNDSSPVVIRVTDANDNRPEFRFPTPTNFNVHVAQPLLSGDNVTRVWAVDVDSGENATLQYSMAEYLQAAPRLFEIHGETGMVYLKRDLEPGDVRGHKLVVRVQDGGRPPLTSSATLYIYLDRGVLPSTYMRAEGGPGPSGPTPHTFFGAVTDTLLLTVCLGSVFICIFVLAGVVLLIIFRRFRRRRKPSSKRERERERDLARARVTAGESLHRCDEEDDEAQHIIVCEKNLHQQPRCALADPNSLLHSGSCLGTMHESRRQCSCCETSTGCDRSLTLKSHSVLPGKITEIPNDVAVIDHPCRDRERESCTPVWKPRSFDKSCMNPACVMCRSVSKTATIHCSNPTSALAVALGPPKRTSSALSSAATLSRDYVVGSCSTRTARRKHVEILTPRGADPQSRGVKSTCDTEPQCRRNEQRNEGARIETDWTEDRDSSSCNFSLSSGNPSKLGLHTNGCLLSDKDLEIDDRDRDRDRGASTGYVTAIAIHLNSEATAALKESPTKNRSTSLQSFNKFTKSESTSFV